MLVIVPNLQVGELERTGLCQMRWTACSGEAPSCPWECGWEKRTQRWTNLKGTRSGCKNTEAVSRYLEALLVYPVSHGRCILHAQCLFNRSNFSCETTGVRGIGFAPRCLIQQDVTSTEALLLLNTGRGEAIIVKRKQEIPYGFEHGSVLTVWV